MQIIIHVDLSHNSLSGTVPPALTNLSSFNTLLLQDNNLTGIDPSINYGLAATLRMFNLAENPWNAPIAHEIGAHTILQNLNLSYRGHTG